MRPAEPTYHGAKRRQPTQNPACSHARVPEKSPEFNNACDASKSGPMIHTEGGEATEKKGLHPYGKTENKAADATCARPSHDHNTGQHALSKNHAPCCRRANKTEGPRQHPHLDHRAGRWTKRSGLKCKNHRTGTA